MTRTETLKIMAVLQAAFPAFYAKKTPEELNGIVALWTELFEDEPYQLVAMAVKALIKTRVSTYPPSIGEINEKLMQITQPELMTEMEAWGIVRKAIRGASMDLSSRLFRDGVQSPLTSAEVNFNTLPELLKKIVGRPEQLAAWEMLPSDEIDTVIQSNFMRSYRAKAKRAQDMLALPSSVKEYMEQLAASMDIRQIEGGQRHEH